MGRRASKIRQRPVRAALQTAWVAGTGGSKTASLKLGGPPHFVADAGDHRIGRWPSETIDLVRVYGEIWKDTAPAHLVDVAVFCDSDDTHTASISYFAYVRLERR
jgi:hypothetical protein